MGSAPAAVFRTLPPGSLVPTLPVEPVSAEILDSPSTSYTASNTIHLFNKLPVIYYFSIKKKAVSK